MFCTFWLLLLHLLKPFKEVPIICKKAWVWHWWWCCGAATFGFDEFTASATHQ